MKMTLAQRAETKRVVDLVLSQCTACADAAETRDLAMDLVHGGMAALVVTAGHEYAIDFLRKLTDVLEAERRGEAN